LSRSAAAREQAALWLARRHDGLSAPEEAAFQAWLTADPGHARAYERIDAVWQTLDAVPPERVPAMRGYTPLPVPASSAMRRPPESGRHAWQRRAALAGLALGVLGAGWLGRWHWQQPTFVQEFATVRGQQLEASLPDGSRLRLDTATRAAVALYRDRREVRLIDGQVGFNVAHDAARPFDVKAGPLRVSVLGTRFSVRHTAAGLGAGSIGVAVEAGRVRVAQAADAVELGPGQAVTVQGNGQGPLVALTPQATGAALAWREGRIVLDDTPLAQVLAEFDRYTDVGLVVPDPAVARMRLTGSFDIHQVAAFRRALPQVLPVRLRGRADGRTEVVAEP